MKKIVYIVHAIDTEGPLYESTKATFERLESTFGIKLGNYIPFCTKNAWAYSYLYYLLFNPFFIISSFYK